MVIVTIRVIVSHENREEVLAIVRSLIAPTHASSGCINFTYCWEIENENALVLMEEWKTQKDLDTHIRSDDFRKILALIDMSSETPQIKISTVLQTAGMEALIASRQSTGPHHEKAIG